jgi:acetyl esterase
MRKLDPSAPRALDPSARRALDADAALGLPAVETCTPPAARADYLASYARSQHPLEDVAAVSEHHLGPLRLKVWRGHGAAERGAPALLYLHGGGWVIGAPETHEDVCRTLANRAGALVVSPDYRLAPEHPFPAALEDCGAALRHMVGEAEALGIDPGRVAIGGDSAGGNLSAVLALMARDGAMPPLAGQFLIYPVTDCRQETESFHECSDGFGLTAAGMRWFRDRYLSGAAADAADWRASPLLAPSLAGVAPAFVALAGCDVLHDEGAAYAGLLAMEARCIPHTWPGQIHGFFSKRGEIPEGAEVVDRWLEAWQVFDPQVRDLRRTRA